MKMVKKTLIAVALVALLATTGYAADNTKDNSVKDDDGWSGHWVWDNVPICTIPVLMDVGQYVQVEKCHEEKIILKQVPCSEINKGDADFPCYLDTEDIKVRANFVAKLTISKAKVGSVLDAWSAGFDGGDTVGPNGTSWETLTIKVTAWKARIWNESPGNERKVGELTILVAPTP
jgi:hypothetical protein